MNFSGTLNQGSQTVVLLTKVHRLCLCARRTGTDTRQSPAGTRGCPLRPQAYSGTRWSTTWSWTCRDRTQTPKAPGRPDCLLETVLTTN